MAWLRKMGGGADEVFYNFDGTKVTKLKVKIEKPGNYGLAYISGDITNDKPTIIDWGNGEKTTLATPITNETQANASTDFYTNYSNPGEYEISIDGWYNHFQCYAYNLKKDGITKISNVLIEIIQVSNLIIDFNYTFAKCWKLATIPDGLFDKNTNATSFTETFSNCQGLTSIPSGLFDKNVNATSFNYTFSNCQGLTSIPSGLFNNNTSVTEFDGTFFECYYLANIPSGLFNNNTSVTKFNGTFKSCSKLTTIPPGLFDNNTKVTDFKGVFDGCRSLTNIPSGLFDKNVNVNIFDFVFFDCENLTGETPYTLSDGKKIKLWDRDEANGFAKPKIGYRAFSNCFGLTDYKDIPSSWK